MISTADRKRLAELDALLDAAGHGLGRLGPQDLRRLSHLYRFTSSSIARLETEGLDPQTLEQARRLLARAHALLFRDLERSTGPRLYAALRWFRDDVPRAIRAEWKLLVASLGLVYGLALGSYLAVRGDLELAYSLMDPGSVAHQIEQLRETESGARFRGNFTFGLGESPVISGWIMAHNIGVAVFFFASALVPPLYLYVLTTNGLMLGTYTAVAAHWGQAGAISSILWCHGTLEIQAIVLAGAAGLVLFRAVVAPGSYTRRHALFLESRRALHMLAAVFPMLVTAGLIEGYVSPHATYGVRIATAVVSGLVLVLWIGSGGRHSSGAT